MTNTQEQNRHLLRHLVLGAFPALKPQDITSKHGNVLRFNSTDASRAGRTNTLLDIMHHLKRQKKLVRAVKVNQGRVIRSDVVLSGAGSLEVMIQHDVFYITIGTVKPVFDLTPQALGLEGLDMTWKDYQERTMVGLLTHARIPTELVAPLQQLFMRVYTGSTQPVDAALMRAGYLPEYHPLVEKSFGEVLGPAFIGQEVWKPARKNIQVIHFPRSKTERLYDFRIQDDAGITHYFSSKAGSTATTNTIKPQDVVKGVDDSKESQTKRTIQRSPEYGILKLLAESSVKEGPLKVYNTYTEYFGQPAGTPITSAPDPRVQARSLSRVISDVFRAELFISKYLRQNVEKQLAFGKVLNFALTQVSTSIVKFSFHVNKSFSTSWKFDHVKPALQGKDVDTKVVLRGKGKDPPGERMGLTAP